MKNHLALICLGSFKYERAKNEKYTQAHSLTHKHSQSVICSYYDSTLKPEP